MELIFLIKWILTFEIQKRRILRGYQPQNLRIKKITVISQGLQGQRSPLHPRPTGRQKAHDLIDGGDGLEAPSVLLPLGEGPIDPPRQVLGAELAGLQGSL